MASRERDVRYRTEVPAGAQVRLQRHAIRQRPHSRVALELCANEPGQANREGVVGGRAVQRREVVLHDLVERRLFGPPACVDDSRRAHIAETARPVPGTRRCNLATLRSAPPGPATSDPGPATTAATALDPRCGARKGLRDAAREVVLVYALAKGDKVDDTVVGRHRARRDPDRDRSRRTLRREGRRPGGVALRNLRAGACARRLRPREEHHEPQPVRIAFHEYAANGRDLRSTVSMRERIGILWHGPDWHPTR